MGWRRRYWGSQPIFQYLLENFITLQTVESLNVFLSLFEVFEFLSEPSESIVSNHMIYNSIKQICFEESPANMTVLYRKISKYAVVFWFFHVSLFGMPTSTDTAPPEEVSDQPAICLQTGELCVVSPLEFVEACFLVPAMRALRRMDQVEKLVVLTPESLEKFWLSVPELDGVIAYPDKLPARKIALVLANAEYQFQSVILWGVSEAGKAMVRAGVNQRIGYPAKGVGKWLSDPVRRVSIPGPIEHRVRYYLNLIEELGGDAFVRQNFQTAPLPDGPARLRIALTEESEYGPSYQWSEEKLEAVKLSMEAAHGAIEWVVVRAGDDKIAEKLPECSCLLACDGEVAHWAAHIGLPAVVVFGPGEPAWKRPLGRQSRVIREHVACSPCYLGKCPLDHRCLDDVQVDEVVAQLNEALAER